MCGIPVAAFATGGIPEVVENDVTGLIVERLSSAALGSAVRRLHDDPEQRRRMGSAAAARATKLFGNTAIARQFVRHYRDEISARSVTTEARI
jgi:glycosyltransferase involved in cell wall biosynthesis